MSYLLGVSAVMAVFLVGVVVFLASRAWRGYEPGDESDRSRLQALTASPTAWTLSFLLVIAVVAGSVVLFVAGSAEQRALVGGVLAAIGGLLLVGYVGYGTYTSSRNHGHTSAVAAMVSAWALGTLFLFAITASLLLA